jgi:ABC-2 type transport system ATP-binding protein
LLSREVRDMPGVDNVIPFGTTLHVSGRDATALALAEAHCRRPGFVVTRVPTSLEDVFVSLMQQAPADVR